MNPTKVLKPKIKTKQAEMNKSQFLCVIRRMQETLGLTLEQKGMHFIVHYGGNVYVVEKDSCREGYAHVIGEIRRQYSGNKSKQL